MLRTEILHVRQLNPYCCGAACLQMAYASLGVVDRQEDIWEAIQSVPLRNGVSMQRLSQHAIRRGFAAMALRARDPWAIAQSCTRHGFPMIVNHRLHSNAVIGHFSVLDAVAGDAARLYDPLRDGPRTTTRAEMLEMWSARNRVRNSGGHLLVLGRPAGIAEQCRHCDAELRRNCRCAGCGQPIALGLSDVLECTASCSARSWESIYCPHCDAELTTLADDPYGAEALFASLGFRKGAEGET